MVKHLVSGMVLLVLVFPLGAQKQSSGASLKETVDWMEKFTRLHGFLFISATGTVAQRNWISPTQECEIVIDRRFLHPNAGQAVKEMVHLNLRELDPDKVETLVEDLGTGPWYEMRVERSDATFNIMRESETSDGTKSQLFASGDSLFLDSEESAKRLGKAFVHAIALCGGKPAPF